MTLKLSVMRWCATLVGVQMLCGIVWVLGPLVPALEPWPARLAILMGLLLVWAVANFLLDWRRTQQEVALAQGVASGASEEAAAVGAKLTTALARMREAKGRRGYLYEQPWYAIIGPPGAGKTTALLNAGLTFPLTNELGPGAVAGVGGTRLCDWWFTEDAVLIDTAGRYTTQDSDSTVDRAGWEAFLSLLRKTRPRQPLNGVIVAIALSDVATEQTSLLDTHARAIRARIDELEARLGVRIPVYVLFTKADLLIGFSEFFADLNRAGREQIWGTTFPLAGPADLSAGLRPLLDRLSRRVFQRLDDEADPDRRALIVGFPPQLASVLPRLQAFVAGAFGPDKAGKTPFLRGVYLTSGTQEGTPIDRLVGTMSRSFGLDQRRAARLRPEAGRSYFLAGLLRDVVFREAMLVVHRPGAERRRRVVRMAGFAACAVAALAGAGVLWTERAASQAAIDRSEQALAALRPVTKDVPLDPVADADFTRILPWLDAVAAKPEAAARDLVGFSQGAKLAAANQGQYHHALAFALFPRLIWRVETQMRGALDQPDLLYEATRIYLMLGGGGTLDRGLVREWFARDWDASLPAEARTALERHLAALLEEPLPRIDLDGPLVAQARGIIGRVPLAQRAWSRLKPLAAANVPPWRPSEALGPAGVTLFVRLSGRGLEEGIPGLFTAEGFRTAVLPALPRVAQQAAAESWVIGGPIAADSPARRTLEADIVGLYATEYAALWDAMFSDLDPAPPRTLTQAAQDLYILASAHSPIRTLLASAAGQLAPGAGAPAGPLSLAMGLVDARYKPVRALFGTGGAAPIDLVMRPLGDLQQQLAKLAATTTRPTAPDPGQDPAAALRAEALRQPQPLARWLLAMSTSGAALRDGGPRGAMIAAWNAGGGPSALCQAVIGNKYPFVPGATADAPLEDFTRLLGPGGAIDAFFNTQLKPYVDTAARPWRAKAVDGVSPPVTAADLAQFQRAAAIRELFFPAGSAQPLVRFDVTPGEVDAGAVSATLEFGGGKVTAVRGTPARPAALSWPGRSGDLGARVLVAGASAPGPRIEDQGPWALFRLVSRARASVAGDRMGLVFTGGERTARFELRASPNPFGSTAVSEFRCPAVQ